MELPSEANQETAFRGTGAVEQDRPEQHTNVAPLDAQLDHRYQDPLNKQSDSGSPERGQNPEFTGEREGRDDLNQDTKTNLPGPVKRELENDDFRTNRMEADNDTDQNAQNFDIRSQQEESRQKPRDEDANPEGALNDQDPGQRQKQNQGDKKNDKLAA